MKAKKIVSIILMLSILMSSLCPISLGTSAYYPQGPKSFVCNGNSESLVIERNDINSTSNAIMNYGAVVGREYYIMPIQIKVSESGIYNIGNSLKTQYVIVTTDENGVEAPLPIATYGSNGQSEMDLSSNNANNKEVNVYLDSSKTYYVMMLGEDGKSGAGLYSNNAGNNNNLPGNYSGSTFNLNINRVEVPEGKEIYETDITSSKYTCPKMGIGANDKLISGWYNSYAAVPSNKEINISGIANSLPADQQISIEAPSAQIIEKKEENASWLETVITWFVLLLCDGFRAAINTALGIKGVSIDDILFNIYANIRLDIFSSDREKNIVSSVPDATKQETFLESSGMLDDLETGKPGIITSYFMLFRNIAIIVYIIMLLYMGIRVLLASTGSKKEIYKRMLSDWVIGIVILIFFPYIMKFTITINNVIVDYVREIRDELQGENNSLANGISSSASNAIGLKGNSAVATTDIMEKMREQAASTGKLAYTFIYLYLIKQLVTFVYIYLKRLLMVIFLIIIFPLVTISYAVDKIADGKSQAFNNWYKEFALNVFLQSFQAINYLVITSILAAISSSGTTNIIFFMIGLDYVSKGDEILRGMFTRVAGGGGAGTVSKNISETTKSIMSTKMVMDVGKRLGGVGKRVTNLTTHISDTRDKYYAVQEAKRNEMAKRTREAEINSPANIAKQRKIADIENNMKIALNTSGARTKEEVHEGIDNLLEAAQGDPNFAVEFGKLSVTDQEKLKKMMQFQRAVTESANGNKNSRGVKLTDFEINLDANVILDAVNSRRQYI